MITISTEKMLNRSAKRVAEVAQKYGYKLEIIHCGRYGKQTAFLWAHDPIYRSPYNQSIESDVRSYSYCKKLFYEYQ